jgi:carboxypeptidase family protein/beta-propeller repeat-containing protein
MAIRHITRVATIVIALAWLASTSGTNPTRSIDHSPGVGRTDRYGHLPLTFEANRGQTDSAVEFLARGDGYGVFLTRSEAVLRLRGSDRDGRATVLRMRLAGANERPRVTGLDKQPGTSNYYIGKDPARWRTEVPHYAKVEYAEVYPGVDLVFYGNQRRLEYDFVVAPGADPGAIGLAFSGTTAITTDTAGNLTLQTTNGPVELQAPVIYQVVDGARHEVAGRYALKESGVVAFTVAEYDRRSPLVIDPVLVYSTFLGGTGQDVGNSIAVDGSGSAYLVGDAGSASFPTLNSNQSSSGGEDAFIAKFNPAGTALVYSTFLGGSTAGTSEHGYDITVDASGNAYAAGTTFSPDFPVTANAFQPAKGTNASQETAFVVKLSAGGTLAYSTFLSGSQGSRAYGIATDGAGNVYVTGPSVNGYPVTTTGAFTSSVSNASGYLTKLNTNASGAASLVYSTYLGPSGFAEGHAIAVDAAGNAYVAGITNATGFASAGAFQTTFAGGTYDAFVAKFNTNVSGAASRVYATYLGGSGVDIGGNSRTSTSTGNHGIAIDASGNAYVVGRTDSTNFPVANAFQAANAGYFDAFLTKVNSTGSALVYSTYLGGSSTQVVDEANAVAVNAVGNAYVTGHTESSNFPLVSPLSISGSTTGGVFVTKFTPAGDTLVYSIRLGRQVTGSTDSDNFGQSIALDAAGNAFIAGMGRASYPSTTGAFQTTAAGITDAFVSQVADPTIIGRVVDQGGNPISSASITLSGTPSGTTTSDANGYFTFGLLTQGNSYTVSATVGNDVLAPQTVGNLQKNVRLQFVANTPSASLDRTSLIFAATNTGTGFSNQTDAQTVRLAQTAGPAVGWTATSNKPWLTVTPASGSGAGTLTVAVKYDASLPASGTVAGAITLALTGALNTAGPINVALNVLAPSAPPSLPIGTVDTPAGDGTVLAGSIAVTGWALDNVGVARVELWRDAQPGEPTPTYVSPLGPGDPRNGKIFIANATFVDGARPDLEGLYASMPYAYRGGWGYLMLTWGLYNQGNGTYKLYAFGVDKEGNTSTIGSKSVVISNNTATKPFGSIDTPTIGGVASGPNFGWALTPKVAGSATCKIQPSGVQVSIDSGPLQPVFYGDARADIAGAFTGFSNSPAAGGHYIFDWSTLANGPHTIGWLVTDDCNRADGVGSRFFTVSGGTGLKAADTPFVVAAPHGVIASSQATERESDAAITVARGYGELPAIVAPGEAGSRTIDMKPTERIEIRVPRGFESAYQLGPHGQRRNLPVGSTWDAAAAAFYWQPAPGFLGPFRLVFSNGTERISVRIVITP